ncbi:FecR family protein [Niastella caeni]|nr:FecR family protein [Niastella caeni]
MVHLIAKQLQGLATAQEAEELQRWLKSDAACQQEYDDMVLIWQKSGPLLANPQFNADIAWLKLDDKIAHANPKTKLPFHTIISFLFSSTQRTAAVVLVLVLIAGGGYWWYQKAQWQTFTAAAKNETFTLPDQSVVLVRKGSSIKYRKTFNKKERQVQLSGEAFFQVQPNENQPFLVATPNAEVKVLGTSFLVNSTESTDEVVVVTGKVNVTAKKESNNQITITKGQRAVLDHARFFHSPVTDSNFIAWKTGMLNFNNTALPKVLQDIAHYYGIQIELAPALHAIAHTFHVTVQFNNQPLAQALEEIALITGLQVKKEKDKVTFYRN